MSNSTQTAPILIPSQRGTPTHESPNVNPIPRLQTRRGSRSAPDPWSLGPLSSSVSASGGSVDNTVAGTYGPGTFTLGGGGGGNPQGSASPANSSPHVGTMPSSALPSSTASRITIVRVHQDGTASPSSAIADDHSHYQPYTHDGSSLGGTPVRGGGPHGYHVDLAQQEVNSRPGRSSSWGSVHSAASAGSAGGPRPGGPNSGRSHSPGASRRPGGVLVYWSGAGYVLLNEEFISFATILRGMDAAFAGFVQRCRISCILYWMRAAFSKAA